jgi:hypothetical protein
MASSRQERAVGVGGGRGVDGPWKDVEVFWLPAIVEPPQQTACLRTQLD